jgi:hypothetical protein
LGGRNQEDHCSKPAQANSSQDSVLKIPSTKKGLVEWPSKHEKRKKYLILSVRKGRQTTSKKEKCDMFLVNNRKETMKLKNKIR